MKKICILFLASAFFLNACNNNKDKENSGTNKREKDDFRNDDKEDNNNTGRWSASEVRSFNKDCDKNMSGTIAENKLDDFCSCLLDKFQDKFSTFSEFNRESTKEDGSTAAEKCMTELGIKKGSDNDGAAWTTKDEQRFMTDCETSAREKTNAARAEEYCDCMLKKTKKRFSSYAEADRGLLQLPEGELQSWMDDCNGK